MSPEYPRGHGFLFGLYLHIYPNVVGCRSHMAKYCAITGKKPQVGGRYSNRTRATQFNPSGKVTRSPNLQKKRIFVAELGKSVTVNVSTKALRTIAKNGAYETLTKAKLI